MSEIYRASGDDHDGLRLIKSRPSTTGIDRGGQESSLEEWQPQKREYLIILCLSIISLVVALDSTILVPALPAIAKDLGGSAIQTFWAGTSYLLTSSTFQPFLAALSDVCGRRNILLLSVGFFTLGSIICCTAHAFTQLLAGRSIQGIGGGGIIALTLVIFTDIIPLRQRPKYNSIVQLAYAFGTITGPLVGGAFAQHASWRWIFYINFPFCAAGLLMVPIVVTLRNGDSSIRAMFQKVDWIGGMLFIGSSTSFLMALTWGGVQFPWGAYQTIVPLVVGALGVIITVFWEARGATPPFIRLTIFHSLDAYAAYTCAMLQGLLLYAQLYYISLYLQAIKNLSPTMNGVLLLPVTCSLIPTSVIVGILITKCGRFRWSVWLGWAISTLATGLLCLLNTKTSRAAYACIFIVVGLGQGLLFSSLAFTAQAIATTEDVAYAAAFYAFSRGVGFTLGVAVGGTVFQNVLAKALAERGLPVEIAKSVESFVPLLQGMPASSTKSHLLDALTVTFRVLFAVLTGVSGVGLLLSFAIRKHDLNKHLDSRHTFEMKDKDQARPGGQSGTQ